jgi:hypothetical protein
MARRGFLQGRQVGIESCNHQVDADAELVAYFAAAADQQGGTDQFVGCLRGQQADDPADEGYCWGSERSSSRTCSPAPLPNSAGTPGDRP